ncbi:hypothetical protein PVAP13_6KG232900 [Panicum virgatum]|uniref:Uncharacterized protein n=1 Tax=Panicum virgatum TaxID=38727 RepID=A0A8T0RFT6_PANVG|nr:hypothetical protein PVAP13_6KG232900 [Panicum virgatum]
MHVDARGPQPRPPRCQAEPLPGERLPRRGHTALRVATTTRSTPLECEASSFDDIWAHDNVAAGLLQGKVPKLALIDSNNHDVVYFVQDTARFALDVRARRVLACEDARWTVFSTIPYSSTPASSMPGSR